MNPTYDFEQPFEDSLLISRRSTPQVPAMASAYSTHANVANVDPSVCASKSLFPSSVSSQGMNLPMAHMNYAGSKGHPDLEAALFRPARYAEDNGQHSSSFDSGDVSFDGLWPYASSTMQEADGSFPWLDGQASQQMGRFAPAMHPTQSLRMQPAYNPPNSQARGPSFGLYAQPSPQQFATTLSNGPSSSFGLNNEIYGSPNDFHAAHQFADLNTPQTAYAGTEGLSLESFPNIIEDEDGMFHIEGGSDSSQAFIL